MVPEIPVPPSHVLYCIQLRTIGECTGTTGAILFRALQRAKHDVMRLIRTGDEDRKEPTVGPEVISEHVFHFIPLPFHGGHSWEVASEKCKVSSVAAHELLSIDDPLVSSTALHESQSPIVRIHLTPQKKAAVSGNRGGGGRLTTRNLCE